jgi:hypothetical protein
MEEEAEIRKKGDERDYGTKNKDRIRKIEARRKE